MKQRHLVTALCFACATLVSTSSWADPTVAPAKGALVDPAKGVVLVNRGKGFSQIKQPVKLKVGNAVMVGPEGGAIITYADHCQVNVAPGAVETITPLSPCASGSTAAAGDGDYHQNYCLANPGACFALTGVAGVFAGIIYDAISP
jgi:hypothetical protein